MTRNRVLVLDSKTITQLKEREDNQFETNQFTFVMMKNKHKNEKLKDIIYKILEIP